MRSILIFFLIIFPIVSFADDLPAEAIECQNLGLAYLEESQPLKAIEQYEKLIELLPEAVIGHANLAVAQLRIKKVDLALQSVKNGLAIDKTNPDLHFILAEIHQFQGKPDLAIAEMKEVIRLDPKNLEALYFIVSENLRKRNDLSAIKNAISDLIKLRDLAPTNIVVLMKLSQALIKSQQIEILKQICTELKILTADIDPEKLNFLDLAITAIENDDFKSASRNLRIFENVNKNSPRYQQGIAELSTPILGHPISAFDPRIRSRLKAKRTKPIEISFEAIKIEPVEMPTKHMIRFDFDHDGDLDALELDPKILKLWRNIGDGTYDDATENAFGDQKFGAIDATFGDFDDDGDLDLITIDNKKLTLYDNLRQGKFKISPLSSEKNMIAIDSADFDHDGDLDLAIAMRNYAQIFLNRGDATFVADRKINAKNGTGIHFVDLDNDGFLDLWILPRSLFRNDGTGDLIDVSDLIPIVSQIGNNGKVIDYDRDGDLDLLHFLDDGTAGLFRNDGGNRNRWIQIELEALVEGGGKNNFEGIGSRLEIKAGDLYQLACVREAITHFGLGDRDRVDVVRVVWTNGVPQNLISPKVDQKIIEKQVLKGSCPFLYAFDGDNFTFVTDLLWKSPLGMITSIGSVASSGSADDYVRIDGDKLKPKNGEYVLQITEELWETAYFDHVKLMAVDHPIGTEIQIDEKFVPPPFPKFQIYTVKEKHFPLSATDHRGRDVRDRLRNFDYWYAIEHESGKFQGVVEPHFIELDLANEANSDQIQLFLKGWIFPTDTSINVSISQNRSISSNFPFLQVLNENGEWQTVIDLIGIPAGKNKTIVIDLDGKFLTKDRRIRIATDMQIYWDSAFFTIGDQAVNFRVTEVDPDFADLHYLGFPKLFRPTPHAPQLYDYSQIDKNQRWRDLGGFYTRYGDVSDLLKKVDDRLVVMNAGDEITLKFDADHFPKLDRDQTRTFIFYSDGWVKDGDLNTIESQTVEPLPFHEMSDYPPSDQYPPHLTEYRLKFNTRKIDHDLPKLK